MTDDVKPLIKWPPVKGMSLANMGHPPGGRCLNTCYCGQCPHYKPIRRGNQQKKPARRHQ